MPVWYEMMDDLDGPEQEIIPLTEEIEKKQRERHKTIDPGYIPDAGEGTVVHR